MSQQIRFFRKNLIDLDEGTVTFTITDATATDTGSAVTNLMLNRDNDSGWGTTGSDDAANTEMLLTFSSVLQLDTIILTGHNLASYTIQYWDLDTLAYVDFSTAISETVFAKDTSLHQFTAVNTDKIKLIITGTQTADADKLLAQFIITRKIGAGELEGWPIFGKPSIDLSKSKVSTISGKTKIIQRVGAYSTSLQFRTWPVAADLEIIEELHFYHPRGFLFWPSGGDEEQFRYLRAGFRAKDIYLCGISSEWEPEWESGVYVNGVSMNLKLVEVV